MIQSDDIHKEMSNLRKAAKQKKGVVVTFHATFKVDDSLYELFKGMPNRSEFIRTALLVAFKNVCPVCQGRGVLTPHQKAHWENFSLDHSLQECPECHEWHIICFRTPKAGLPKSRGRCKG